MLIKLLFYLMLINCQDLLCLILASRRDFDRGWFVLSIREESHPTVVKPGDVLWGWTVTGRGSSQSIVA